MADLVDKSESELQQLIQKVVVTLSDKGIQATLRVTKDAWDRLGPIAITKAVGKGIKKQLTSAHSTGQVSIKDFTKHVDGKRDVVNIDDRAVSKELEKELRRHGVLWSVEHNKDGSRTFHVQGKDAELVQNALEVAAERVDQKLAREAPEPQHDDAAPTHAADELRDDAPRSETASLTEEQPADHGDVTKSVSVEPDEAGDDRGGHSIERQPASTRSEQRPEMTGRDRTRGHVAERIGNKVTARKAELNRKPKTKKRSQAPQVGDDAAKPPTTQRR